MSDNLTKKQKEIYDLWILLGKSPDDPDLQRLLQPVRVARRDGEEVHAKKVREAEAVLLHLHHLKSLTQVFCENCGEPFATNYEYNKHCSDECLRRTMHGLGLNWNPEKTPEERWQAQPPSVITPITLSILKKWAKEILSWDESKPKKPTPISPNGDPYKFLQSLL